MQFCTYLLILSNVLFISIIQTAKLKSKAKLKEKSKQSLNAFSPFQGSDNLVFNSQEGRNEYNSLLKNIDYNHHFNIKPAGIQAQTATGTNGSRLFSRNLRSPIIVSPKITADEMPGRPCVIRKVENIPQKVYNPVPVMTHYNMPVFHHIPINEVVKKYIPVYYPIPIEHKINIPVKIPIKIPQRVLIPQAVPYGVKVPVPVPYRVEIPQYKEIEIKKPLYVKIPVYEHIPIYHHFLIKDKHKKEKTKENSEDETIEDCEEESSSDEINKQTNNYISKTDKEKNE